MYYSQTNVSTGLDALRAPLRPRPQSAGCERVLARGARRIVGIPAVWGRDTLLSALSGAGHALQIAALPASKL